jgi:hypothetical protein
MKYYRITKYDPLNRNEKGHYLYNHWTEFGDIGKTLEGELVTIEKYLTVESDYIDAVIQILKENKVEHLRVVGLDKKLLKYSINENKGQWFHRHEFETVDLFEDKKVTIDEIEIICQMNFRYYCGVSFEIKDKFYIHFGYDMYMYVGAPNLSDELMKELNSTSVFVEECYSPYYSENLEYTLQRSKKRSKYVLDEQVLKNVSIAQIKKAMKFSDEHPGIVNMKINKKIADELELKVDFTKYIYYITTENILD